MTQAEAIFMGLRAQVSAEIDRDAEAIRREVAAQAKCRTNGPLKPRH
jgi:hypothetical protein